MLLRPLALALVMGLTVGGISQPASAKAPASAKGRKAARAASLPAGTQRPTTEVLLSVGQGQLVTLPTNVADVWTSNPGAADVYVNNQRQIYVFGKEFGEATIFATTASGAVAYATNVRVSQNITSIDRVMKMAMPDADIRVTTAGQLAILTGTVASPEDAAQAEQLAKAYLNPGIDTSGTAALKIGVFSRLRIATPLQVNLQVRIAEVNRSLVKSIGVNLATLDTTGGFQFGIQQGGSVTLNPSGGGSFLGTDGGTSIAGFGKLFGVDIGSALDLAETQGLVSTLAQPNLTALSGETASFLAGGEFPIPISQDIGTVTIQYKQYGVSLAFTPTVLADGRISMRVRPEVSELTNEGSLRLNGFNVPGITTRRAETTIELGSGQAFMIGGLLRNTQTNSIDRAPGLGNIPILGALFRSTSFRKSETELVIVVTPYLVKPVSANQIALPTDGFKAATDAERVFLGKLESGKTGEKRPTPTMAPPATVTTPSVGAMLSQPRPAEQQSKKSRDVAAPGFSGN
jgi:pilus assembly protein CpaC